MGTFTRPFPFLQSSRAFSREETRHWLVRSHVLVITPDTSLSARGIFLINKTSRRTFCRSNGPLFVPFLFPLSHQHPLGNPFASPSQHADISFDSVNTCPVVGDVETPTVPFLSPFLLSRVYSFLFIRLPPCLPPLFYFSSFPVHFFFFFRVHPLLQESQLWSRISKTDKAFILICFSFSPLRVILSDSYPFLFFFFFRKTDRSI